MKTNRIPTLLSSGLRAIAVVILACSVLLVPSESSALRSSGTPDLAALDAFYEAQVAANNLKGMAVIIVKADGKSGGSIIYQRGFGMAGRGLPFTPQTPFPISSGSKSFLALSVMQLVEAGRVELDAPIQRYLPWWQVADPEISSQITVRDLLNQVTGLVAGPGFYDDSGMSSRLPPETSMEEAVRDLRTARPMLPLRSAFRYFDPNYWTLGVLVEKISGRSYPEYLKEHVFGPLGMTNTTTTAQGAPAMAEGNLTLFGFPVSYRETINQKYLLSCCGVISTTEDLGNYLIAQLNLGQQGDTRLLSPQSMRVMHAPRTDVEPFMGMQYAMGWTVEEENGIRRVEDPGTWATYSSEMTLLPDQGYGIAIFYNQGCFAPQMFGFPAILDGTINLLTGSQPAGGVSVRAYGWILAGIACLTIGLEIFQLARLGRWNRKARALPTWRKALDVGLPLVEAALLSFGFVHLVAVLTAKTFLVWTALLWWTDLIAWLLLLSLLLLIKGLTRFWLSIRA